MNTHSSPPPSPADQPVSAPTGNVEHLLGEGQRGAQRRIGLWKAEAGRLIRENPAACIIGAVVVGFALARVAHHA
jgi:hypothetical protein